MSIRDLLRKSKRRLLILFYNDFFGNDPAANPPPECQCECEFTSDRRRFREADAVAFHIPTMPPTWIRLKKQTNQKWVAWSMESAVNYLQLKSPKFMAQFDLTMTYRLNSDVPVLYVDPGIADALRTPPVAKTGEAPVVLFSSNSRELSGRTEYFEEMMQYIAVDSYGKHLRNRELPAADEGRATKLSIIARYKFTLAFENSVTHDYVTEKLFDPLIAGSVPVYNGTPNIDEFAPGDHCYINARDFAGPRESFSHHLQRRARRKDDLTRHAVSNYFHRYACRQGIRSSRAPF